MRRDPWLPAVKEKDHYPRHFDTPKIGFKKWNWDLIQVACAMALLWATVLVPICV